MVVLLCVCVRERREEEREKDVPNWFFERTTGVFPTWNTFFVVVHLSVAHYLSLSDLMNLAKSLGLVNTV